MKLVILSFFLIVSLKYNFIFADNHYKFQVDSTYTLGESAFKYISKTELDLYKKEYDKFFYYSFKSNNKKIPSEVTFWFKKGDEDYKILKITRFSYMPFSNCNAITKRAINYYKEVFSNHELVGGGSFEQPLIKDNDPSKKSFFFDYYITTDKTKNSPMIVLTCSDYGTEMKKKGYSGGMKKSYETVEFQKIID